MADWGDYAPLKWIEVLRADLLLGQFYNLFGH